MPTKSALVQGNISFLKGPDAITKSTNSPSTSSISDSFICSVLEDAIDSSAYPRTCLHVSTQEIKVDGAVNSVTLNGLCLALLDSGIKLRHVFCSITVAKIAEQFVIEPNSLELSSAESIFTFVFKPSLTTGGTLIASDSAGQFSLDKLVSASELAEKEALGIFDFYRTQIYQKFGHSLKTA
ncbi:3' exoribonuclease family, domain 2 domain-containing protein [Ditylenchus destructor]|uniref:3' exoribonuclease family, domain 2 domain-containing protein n=1 Tax=Ditylenchus destructor TaxID=166010 RepID=A0AAD4N5P5_9BILA|nr:3' exoribonuclease family, domain 2 domain-containing protein [Ditylenchus destructor]